MPYNSDWKGSHRTWVIGTAVWNLPIAMFWEKVAQADKETARVNLTDNEYEAWVSEHGAQESSEDEKVPNPLNLMDENPFGHPVRRAIPNV